MSQLFCVFLFQSLFLNTTNKESLLAAFFGAFHFYFLLSSTLRDCYNIASTEEICPATLKLRWATFAWLAKVGGRGSRLDEPLITTTYVSVFITHFLGSTSENREILRKLYLDFDLSSYQIADLSGYSRPAISDFLKREGTKKSKRKSTRPKYGERLAAGKLRVPHLAELKIIEKIVRLKNQGKSFRKIAEVLNSAGILSKRGGQWSKTTVQDVYNRHEEGRK